MSDRDSKLLKLMRDPERSLSSGRGQWEDYKRVNVLRSWADELKAAVEHKASKEDWILAGHAVMLIGSQPAEARNIFSLVAQEAGFKFLSLDVEEVIALQGADAGARSDILPCLVYIEPGHWLRPADPNTACKCEEKLLSVQDQLCKIIRAFDPENPIIFATSSEYLKDIDEIFREVGLFDRRFERGMPVYSEIGEEFLRLVGIGICAESLLTQQGKIGKLIKSEYPDSRRQGLIALAMKRVAAREKRLLEFNDLVNLALRGSGEKDQENPDSAEMHRIVAAHEAGHAVVAVIDSDGLNIPEYASAFPVNGFGGIVSGSYAYEYQMADRMSYKDFRHEVRVGLAGRAAEHLLLNPENITVRGSISDLERVTRLCGEMFAVCGVAPDMDCEALAGSNLAVVVGEPSPSEVLRVETLTQRFLEKQYQAVLEILEKNRQLLDMVARRLLSQRVLDQADLRELISANSARNDLRVSGDILDHVDLEKSKEISIGRA